jgi:hypothetical protein
MPQSPEWFPRMTAFLKPVTKVRPDTCVMEANLWLWR